MCSVAYFIAMNSKINVDRDCVCWGDVRVSVEELTAFLEEAYIPEGKCPCPSPFFCDVDAKVFTGAYVKEYGSGT